MRGHTGLTMTTRARCKHCEVILSVPKRVSQDVKEQRYVFYITVQLSITLSLRNEIQIPEIMMLYLSNAVYLTLRPTYTVTQNAC